MIGVKRISFSITGQYLYTKHKENPRSAKPELFRNSKYCLSITIQER